MAHFAQIDENNIVINILVVGNENCLDSEGNESEQIGISYLESLFGHRNWIQTSFNNNIRTRYATIGGRYDPEKDMFIDYCDYNDWVIDENGNWNPPVPQPKFGMCWDNDKREWVEPEIPFT